MDWDEFNRRKKEISEICSTELLNSIIESENNDIDDKIAMLCQLFNYVENRAKNERRKKSDLLEFIERWREYFREFVTQYLLHQKGYKILEDKILMRGMIDELADSLALFFIGED